MVHFYGKRSPWSLKLSVIFKFTTRYTVSSSHVINTNIFMNSTYFPSRLLDFLVASSCLFIASHFMIIASHFMIIASHFMIIACHFMIIYFYNYHAYLFILKNSQICSGKIDLLLLSSDETIKQTLNLFYLTTVSWIRHNSKISHTTY